MIFIFLILCQIKRGQPSLSTSEKPFGIRGGFPYHTDCTTDMAHRRRRSCTHGRHAAAREFGHAPLKRGLNTESNRSHQTHAPVPIAHKA
jgi:hypothetical protein